MSFKLYTKKGCSYCSKAVSYIKKVKGVDPIQIDYHNDLSEQEQAKVLEQSNMNTFPMVFYDNKLIGGYDDLIEYDPGVHVSDDLVNIVFTRSKEYVLKPKFQDLYSVCKDNTLIWSNPKAVDFLKPKLNELDSDTKYHNLSSNPNILYILDGNIKNHEDKLDYEELSRNENAILILERNIQKVNWDRLSQNPNALKLIENNLDKVNIKHLCGNINGVHIIDDLITKYTENYDEIDWNRLSANPNAIDTLKKYPKKIKYNSLSTNPEAIDMLKSNKSKIVLKKLCKNNGDGAAEILKEYIKEHDLDIDLDWKTICANTGYGMEELIAENITKADFHVLSGNPNAIDILNQYPERIDYKMLETNINGVDLMEDDVKSGKMIWKNPSIFERKSV